jgi:hypothetical protein
MCACSSSSRGIVTYVLAFHITLDCGCSTAGPKHVPPRMPATLLSGSAAATCLTLWQAIPLSTSHHTPPCPAVAPSSACPCARLTLAALSLTPVWTILFTHTLNATPARTLKYMPATASQLCSLVHCRQHKTTNRYSCSYSHSPDKAEQSAREPEAHGVHLAQRHVQCPAASGGKAVRGSMQQMPRKADHAKQVHQQSMRPNRRSGNSSLLVHQGLLSSRAPVSGHTLC